MRADRVGAAYRAELGLTLPSGEFRRPGREQHGRARRARGRARSAPRRGAYDSTGSRQPPAPGAGQPARPAARSPRPLPRAPGPWRPDPVRPPPLSRHGRRSKPPRREARRRTARPGEPSAAAPATSIAADAAASRATATLGYWCPVLHAHLPYVRHPEYPEFLEEDWFFEALTETYVPLVRVLDGLLDDGVDYRLTMTLSPPPALDDARRAARRALPPLPRPAGRAGGARDRSHARAMAHRSSRRWPASTSTSSRDVRRIFRDTYGSDLVRAFRKHRDAGKLEIITCGATHGFLPADGRRCRRPCARRCRSRSQHYRRLLGATRRASGCPSAATCPATSASCRKPASRFSFLEIARPHRRRSAADARRAGAHPLARRRRVLRARPGVVAAGVERGGGLPRRLRLPRVLPGRRLGAAARLPGRPPRPTGCARTSASSTTA